MKSIYEKWKKIVLCLNLILRVNFFQNVCAIINLHVTALKIMDLKVHRRIEPSGV